MIPEKDGSSPKRSIIFIVSPLGEMGLLPPPVFCLSVAILECTLLAELNIPLHFSFISVTDLLQTPKEFTWSVISSHTLFLFLFVIAFVNLLFIIFIFSSATVKSNVHSAAVKFGFLARFAGSLFSAIFVDKVTLEWSRIQACGLSVGYLFRALSRLCATTFYALDNYPVDSSFIQWIGLSTG